MPFKLLILAVLVACGTCIAAGPQLLIEPGAAPKIEASGTPGEQLRIEAVSSLQEHWELLSSFILTNHSARWTDVWCGTAPRRFYRITRSPGQDAPFAANFTLLDQQDRARELFYLWGAEEIKAFVLIFTANGCEEIERQLPAIQELRNSFESKGVVFWMINSNPGDSRAEIAAEAARLGIQFPVLQDRAQTVAHLYNARGAGEVICIDRQSLSVFYRGAIDDRTTAAQAVPTQNYLEEALNAHLEGKAYYIRETKPPGCNLAVNDAAIPNYSREIAPILQAKCVSCHSPGNVAPWSMTNHAIVQAYAPAMIDQISSRSMPPWHADPEYGKFKNDISLTVAEEQLLIRWLAAGAERGDGPDPLEEIPEPAPKWPAELGEPDLIIRAPEQHIMATGVEPYRYIFVDTGLEEDVWLRAAIVRPTNRKVVHHYLVWEGASMLQMAVGLTGYVPGSQRGAFPEGTGVLLRGNTPLTFNLHYTPYGEEAVDQPELALWFHKTPPAKALITLPLLNLNLSIPPGAREHEVNAGLLFVDSLPYAGTLYAVTPHMHVRGKRMRFEVVYPDNRRETLLSVPDYDFNWQTTYQLAEPKKIPAGSKLFLTGAFDNSDLNLANPNSKLNVRWGEQSWEEMFIGYFDFTQD